MKSYFLLTVLFGVIAFISIILLIVGITKKQKNILTIAVVLLVVGIGGCAYAIIAYTKEAYHYVMGNTFQKDIERGANLAGQTFGSVSSGLARGMSKTVNENAIRTLAGKSASILGSSIKIIASKLDSTLGNKEIFIDTSLAASHLELGRANEQFNDNTNELSIFIRYSKAFRGKLKLTNYDRTGRTIEIAQKEIDVKDGQEEVEVFRFPHSGPGLTTYYILSKTE